MEAVTVRGLEEGVSLGGERGNLVGVGGMNSGGSGVWLGEEEAGKWFRLHQCKGEVK